MLSGISQFFDTTSGPRRLRRQLRRKTAYIRTFARDIKKLERVNSNFPANVFGGNLFTVFSSRLQDMLENTIQPGNMNQSKGSNRSDTAMNPELDERQNGTTIVAPTDHANGSAQPWTPTFQESDTSSLLNLIPEIRYEDKKLSFAGENPNPATQSDIRNSNTPKPDNRRNTAADAFKDEDAPRPQNDKGSSALSPLLYEYWQLRQAERVPAPKVARKNVEFNSLPNKIYELPSSVQPNTNPSSWTRTIAHQAARDILQLSANRQPHRISGSMARITPSAFPDRIEIQNVFNIDMHARQDDGDTAMYNLSEKIADILREQALQHGIDIT